MGLQQGLQERLLPQANLVAEPVVLLPFWGRTHALLVVHWTHTHTFRVKTQPESQWLRTIFSCRGAFPPGFLLLLMLGHVFSISAMYLAKEWNKNKEKSFLLAFKQLPFSEWRRPLNCLLKGYYLEQFYYLVPQIFDQGHFKPSDSC